jgi:ketosteroid isomerase-like protein
MSSANVDLVRSLRAAWDRGDFSSSDSAHPEIEYVIVGGPSSGSWTGLAGMTKGWRDFLSTWEDWRAEATAYRDLDDERVLALVNMSGRVKTSGLQVRTNGANLFHVRGGKVTRLVLYLDRERALADLGLASEVAPGDSPRARVDVWREVYEGWARDS